MKSNTIKIEKKRFFKCPQCNSFTRIGMKKDNVLVSLLGGLLGAALFKTHISASDEVCKKCGNKTDLDIVFLKTEIDANKKEVAYYTEANDRVSLI